MDSMYVEVHGKEIVQMKEMKPSKPWMRELEVMSEMAGAYEEQMVGFDEGMFKTLFSELLE
ncbi:MAG: hypothetical protein IJR07_12235 [Bacteroidaceae bacterium]|nr:hypothetical protein [Bacteroidaceae bacterium]